jgi:predicted P-loop ATPase
VQGKEAAEQIRGVWLLEMGELAGLRKAEVEVIKNFISRQEDSYRPAYGIKKETYPRQCIFIGTTNTDDFLRDATGNRRFWPVPVDQELALQSVHRHLDTETVAQIWGEAMAMYRGGESLFLDEVMEAAARLQQEHHSERDSRTGLIRKYLETKLPENWDELGIYERRAFLAGDALQAEGTVERWEVSVAEIWLECLGGQVKEMTTNNTKPIHDMMKRMKGWSRGGKSKRDRGTDYGRQTTYVKIDGHLWRQ